MSDFVAAIEEHVRELVRREVQLLEASRPRLPDLPERLLVSVAEAAELLDCSEQHVRDTLVDTGQVQVVEGHGRGVKITVESLRKWVDRQSVRRQLRSVS